MVAVLLIALALFILLNAFPMASRALRQARDLNIATRLLETEMERMRALGYTAMTSQSKTCTVSMTNNGTAQTLTFTSTVTVTESPLNRKLLRVVISWSTDMARSVEANTYVTSF